MLSTVRFTILFLLGGLLGGPFLHAQSGAASPTLTVVVKQVPAQTALTDTLYLACNQNGWSPKHSSYRLLYRPAQQGYVLQMPAKVAKLAFKFTLGSWQSVEVQANGQDITDRYLAQPKYDTTVYFTVAGWKDPSKTVPRPSTASANVQRPTAAFGVNGTLDPRNIWVYLPPDYDQQANKRFAVLYMHDGQNLFDRATSYQNEWRVDETLDSLAKLGQPVPIVVGINSTGRRMEEMAIWANEYAEQPEGAAYIDLIVQQIKPWVDQHYRTLPQAQHTGIMGSSLGGLISFYGALRYPQTFGKVGVFSPSFWYHEQVFNWAAQQKPSTQTRFYMLAGEPEGGQIAANTRKMAALMEKRWGLGAAQLSVHIDPQGQHMESFWGQWFKYAVLWLYRP